jgi:ABC-type nitrate/sulfonate/bicarbonate transport system substrate-binding protein
MQAAWVNDAEFSGYFVAIDKGWYKEVGLDLEYKPGGPDVIPEGTLLARKADLALTTPDTTVNLIIKERAPLKIIGTQYQKSPLGIVSLSKSNIKAPKDLVGKTLAVPPVNLLSVEALLKINGIPKNEVKIVPYQYDPTPLIKGEVDATVDFTTNVPFTIQQKGVTPYSFLMYDYGFTIYNDTVVVLEDTLHKKRADLVKWLRASRRGWIENLADPSKYPPTFSNTYFKDTGRTIDNEKYFNNAQKPLIESNSGIFSMSEAGIQANIKALGEIGLNATRDMFVTDLINEI